MTRGYTTPEPPDGYPTVCFKMEVPNAPEYRQAILGQISHLFRWYAWQRTGDRTGAETAEVLKQYALTMEFLESCQEAGTNVIFRQTECTLEASTDNGETWIVIFDANPCKPTLLYVDGNIVYDGDVIVSGDTIINNTIIQPDTEHIKPDGIDKRCNMASYLVDIPLPDLVTNLITEYQNAQDSDAFILAMLGLGALVVTGGVALGFIGAISGGLALGGIATAGAYKTVEAVMNAIDITALQAELTTTFWQQDLKCVIYCNLSNDAILDDEQMIIIADAIDSDLTATYPNASQLLSTIFRTLSVEARAKFQHFGSVYDGSNCDLCTCNTWQFNLHTKGYHSKYELLLNNTIQTSNIYRDGTNPLHSDNLYVELDVRKTSAILTGAGVLGKAYKESNDPDDEKVTRLELWDEQNQTWITQWERFYSSGASGANLWSPAQPSGHDIVFLFPCSRVRFTMGGWGIGSASWEHTKLQIRIKGSGLNIFQQEYDEFHGT